MAVDIHATGFMGIAFEAVYGTYVAPTKFFPILSTDFDYQQDTNFRRPIRGIADLLGAVAGNSHVEGNIEMEALDDVVPYFLYASRNTVAKTGAGPYVYTTTPYHGANPVSARSLSITIVKNGIVQGFVGCLVGSFTFTVDNGMLKFSATILGTDEASQSLPTPTYSNQVPYGFGTYTIGIPTGSTVTDVESFSFEVNDNASAEFRLTGSRKAQFTRYGEREVQISMTRDFQSRTEYDAFKALTSQSVRILASQGASNKIQLTSPVAIRDEYKIGELSSQGDLVMAEMTWRGIYDTATSKAYDIVVTTPESIT